MALFRPIINALRELWFALDTASATMHRGSVSDEARRCTLADPTRETRPAV